MLKSSVIPLLAISASACSMEFPPLCDDFREAIDFRVSVAQSSVGMVRMYLEQIAEHSDDADAVNLAVTRSMQYLWNISILLGEPFELERRITTCLYPFDDLNDEDY